jgi:hypothetical protein
VGFDINGIKNAGVDEGYITLTLRGMSIRGPLTGGCAGTGIRVQMALMPQFDDVFCTDFGGQLVDEETDEVLQKGGAWEFRAQTGAYNSQDAMLTNCGAMRSRIGMKLQSVWHLERRSMMMNQKVENHVIFAGSLKDEFN